MKSAVHFNYWYPVDLRSSGKDLVPNHLLFFLFHHVALFEEENWPKALAVNGFVSLEGQKMSKSKGPILTMESAVSSYGADITRMYILSTAEQTQDADWQKTGIESARRQVDRFYSFAKDVIESGKRANLEHGAKTDRPLDAFEDAELYPGDKYLPLTLSRPGKQSRILSSCL